MGHLPQGQAVDKAKDLLRLVLEQGDVIGQDDSGSVVLMLRAPPYLFEALCEFGAADEDFEPDLDDPDHVQGCDYLPGDPEDAEDNNDAEPSPEQCWAAEEEH